MLVDRLRCISPAWRGGLANRRGLETEVRKFYGEVGRFYRRSQLCLMLPISNIFWRIYQRVAIRSQFSHGPVHVIVALGALC